MRILQHYLARGLTCFLLIAAQMPASAYRLDYLPPPDPNDGITFRVLCLHDVRDNLRATFADNPDPFAIETGAVVDLFEWLRAKDYHPISVSQILASRAGGPPLPPRPVLLTIDDGYTSTYTKVFPLLKEFNYPAVVALVTSWTDAPSGTRIRLSPKIEVDRDFFMNWDQVREMSGSGLVEFASHSHDLHRGVVGNPQGNELPAAASRGYDPATGRYETDEVYRDRIRADLQHSIELITQHTGQPVRTIAWPYGAHNRDTDDIATSLGVQMMMTLQPGPNRANVPLTQVRRALMDYEVNVATMNVALREPETYHGNVHLVQRVVQVDLDYVYDADPAQQERNLSLLIDRMKDLAPSAVYLQAFADPKGDGDITEVYFPNRHLPMRADLFNRVAWQLKTRANTLVYAWLPVLTYSIPPGNPAHGRVVQSATRPAGERGLGSPTRLSPFDPVARQVISEIYEDLSKSAHFDGLLFHDDAVLDDTEDNSPAALATYASWGLPADISAIHASPTLAQKWVHGKTQYLIDFTHHLRAIVQGYQNDQDMLTVRNLYAQPVLDPKAEAWFAQSLTAFLGNYDYVALMAMPQMEGARDPDAWMRQLVKSVQRQQGLPRTIFELQARDWNTGQSIASAQLKQQMTRLRRMGAIHYGYYPDDFIGNHPDAEVIRDVMSLKSQLEKRRLNNPQRSARQAVLSGQPTSR